MNVFETLRRRWIAEGIPVAEPATSEQIAAVEQQHGISLPPDFKEYLSITGGMQQGAADEELLSFVSLETINDPARWSSTAPARKELIVADCLMFSHWYVIELKPEPTCGPVYATHDGDEFTPLAPSFQAFVEAYLANSERIACFWTAGVSAQR